MEYFVLFTAIFLIIFPVINVYTLNMPEIKLNWNLNELYCGVYHLDVYINGCCTAGNVTPDHHRAHLTA